MTPRQENYLIALCPSFRPYLKDITASQANKVITALEHYHGIKEPRKNPADTIQAINEALLPDRYDYDLPTSRADEPKRGKLPIPEPQPEPQPEPKEEKKPRPKTPDEDPMDGKIPLYDAILRGIVEVFPELREEKQQEASYTITLGHAWPTVEAMFEAYKKNLPTPEPKEHIPSYTPPAPGTENDYIRPRFWSRACQILDAGLNLLLTGPAGNGKSRFAREYAAAIQSPYHYISFSGGLSLVQLIGGFQLTVDENGQQVSKFVPSAWLESLKEPGVSALEELMAADPEVSLWLNAVLEASTRTAQTPDGVIQVHPDHKFVALSNGTGRSESRAYSASARQDESLLNRFVAVRTNYEREVDAAALRGLDETTINTVLDRTTHVRERTAAAGIILDVGPRQLDACRRLIASGMPVEEAAAVCLVGHLTAQERQRAGITLNPEG